MDTVRKTVVGVVVAFSLVVTGSGIAHAAEDQVLELGEFAAEAVPAWVENPGDSQPMVEVPGGQTVDSGETQVFIPTSASEDIVVSLAGEEETVGFTIGLPANAVGNTDLESDGDAAAFEGEDASTVVHGFEEGLRITTVIDEAEKVESFDYELPTGVEPIINGDGSVTLRSVFTDDDLVQGESIVIDYGTVDAAWAVDANGDPVETWYEVADGLLRQVVKTDASTVFPVVADPTFWWGWNAFIPHSVHQRVLHQLIIGAAGATIANIFVSYIPHPYVQLAVRLAAAMAVAGVALWTACNRNGRGVIIGQSWLAQALPPGVTTTFIRHGYFCLPQ